MNGHEAKAATRIDRSSRPPEGSASASPPGLSTDNGRQPDDSTIGELLFTSSDGICQTTPDGRLLHANPALARMYGYESPGEMLACVTDVCRQLYVHPEDRAELLRRLEADGEIHDFECPVRRKDGQIIWISQNSRVVRGDDGKVLCFEGVIRDITARKQAEQARQQAQEELERRVAERTSELERVRADLQAQIAERSRTERRLAAAYAVSRVLAEAQTLAEASPRIIQAVCESLDWTLGVIWEVDRSANRLRCVEVWHAPGAEVGAFIERSRQTAFSSGVGLPGRIWASSQPAWIVDVTRDTNFPRAPIAAAVGLHGAFGFPIRRGPELLGVIEFFSPSIQEPDPDLLRMMETVGGQIGQFIERKRAEESLHAEHALLHAVAEGTTDAVFVKDCQGRYVLINRSGAQYLGRTVEEVLGKDDSALFDADSAHPIMEGDRRVLAADEAMTYEDETRVGGVERTFLSTKAPYRDAAGNVIGLIGIARDITDRKRVEAELRRRARLAAFGAEIGAALTESDTLRHMLQGCAEAVVRHLDAAFARVWTLNEEEQVLELQASAGMYTHLDGPHSRIAVGQYKIGRIAQDRRPHLTNDVLNDPHISDRDWANREGMVAFAGYPLIIEDQLVGVLAMFARHPLPEATLEALAAASRAIALGIERKWSDDELRLRTRQRVAVAYLLQQALLGTNPNTLMNEIVALLGMILEVEFCAIWELAPGDEVLRLRAGIGWKERLIGQATVGLGTHSQPGFTLASGKPVIVEDPRTETRFTPEPLLLSHGVVSGMSVPIRDRDHAFGVLSVHAAQVRRFTGNDAYLLQSVALALVTAIGRQRAEAALKESDERHRRLFHESMTGNFVATPEGRLELCNAAFVQMLGFESMEQALATNTRNLYPAPADREVVIRLIRERGRLDGYEHVLLRRDGRRITVIEKVVGSFNDDGELVRFQGYLMDITERKRAQEELERERDRLGAMIAAAREGIVVLDRQGIILEANDIFAHVLGLARAGDVVHKQMLDFADPADLDRCRDAIDRCFDQGALTNFSFSLTSQNGDEVPVNLNAQVMRGAGAGPGRAMCLVTDISELEDKRGQMKVAREIQKQLLPRSAPTLPGFDIAAAAYPSKETSGDFFDFIPMLDGYQGIIVADASGKGVGGSMLSTLTHAYLRGLTLTDTDVGRLLARTNGRLAEEVGEDHYVTLFFARLDPRNRSLVWSGAGHRAFIMNAAGAVRELESSAPPLGLEPTAEFPTDGPLCLVDGDIVLLLTDGIDEALNADDQFFGLKRAFDVIRANRDRTAREIIDALYHAVCAFAPVRTHHDDITAVIIKVGSKPG